MDVQQLSGTGAGLAAGPAHRRADRERPVPAARTGPGRALVLAGAAAAAVACAAAAVALLAGFRWFVVETPSMGTAAPVGSLVITGRAAEHLQPGTVIAFTPPGPVRTYTHRIVAVAPDGEIRTKGDINDAPDAWTIRPAAVLGQAVAIVPGLGYAVRGLPALIAGTGLMWLATWPIGRRDRRASARVTGLHLVATVVVLWLQPFVRIVVITAVTGATGARAAVVSTGVLPVRLVDSAGAVIARLTAGRPEVVAVPQTSTGADRITAVADLGWQLQALLVGLAVLPSLGVLLVGLPRGPRHRT